MTAEEVSQLVASEIAGDWARTNSHGVDLKKCLTAPRLVKCRNTFSKLNDGKPLWMWIVLEETPGSKDGYLIVFDEKCRKFGLAVWGGEEPVFWAFTVRSWRQLKGCKHGGPLAGTMEETKYPSGWNEDRAHKLIAHYEQLDENEQVAEDEAAKEAEGPTLMLVPTELVPVVRELIAHKPVE